VCSTLLPQLRRKGGGLIINVSSHAARKAFPGWGAYCTSKAALEAFSRCLAEEERCHGIRVSTLTLGSVDSSLWDSPTVRADFDRRAMLPTDRVADTLLQIAQHPLTISASLRLAPMVLASVPRPLLRPVQSAPSSAPGLMRQQCPIWPTTMWPNTCAKVKWSCWK
jgi:NAD(P)-dependent dehydrogenase (short-subunit alcohol dehydrogenase family)